MIENNELITELKVDTNEIKIIQITDTHILDDEAPSFNDYDTSASLKKITEEIIKVDSDVDLILLTGDLVHEATETSYQKLADHLSVLTTPILCLPGNHDNPELMKYVMGSNGYDTGNLIKAGEWLIVLLNTCVIGEHRGKLSNEELDFLRFCLESNSENPCLIALHHHPVKINSSWMDAMGLINSEKFINIIDDFKQVKAVIWGHIHQEFECNRNNVRLLGTPSTCLQFKPESDAFDVDNKPPAYRRLLLKSDGSVDTNVIYLDD